MARPDRTYQGSQQQYGVVIDRDVVIPARDGTPLATTIYRPALDGRPAPGRYPTILERTPYDRQHPMMHTTGLFFARRGYVAAFQDVRGRFGSGGDFYYLYNLRDEGNDGYDTVEWLAAQDWSDGQVGTIGVSYTGATQQALAVRRPPHLVTQFVGDTSWNYFLKGTTRHGGAFQPVLSVPYVLWLAMTGHEARRDPLVRRSLEQAYEQSAEWLRHFPPRRGATPLRFAPTYEGWFFDILTQSDYGEFWKNPGGNLQEFVDDYPDIPLFFFTSWYGHHTWSNFVKYNALKQRHQQPIKLVVGIWIHGWDMLSTTSAGEVDFGLEASLGDFNSLRLKWFDHWMKGYRTDIMDGAPIDLFVMGGGSGRRNLEGKMEHGGRWRHATAWPLPETRFTPYYLRADGSLRLDPPAADEPASGYSFDPATPVPTLGGNFQDVLRPAGIAAGGAFDQRGRSDLVFCTDTLPLAQRPDVLVFQTEPLEEEVEVTGPIVVKLWVSTSAVDTDFTAKLIDVYPPNDDYPDGFAMNLADSIVRLRYRNGFDRAELVEPGQVYEITIEPQPTSNRFMPGHRIRLDISSSNFPMFDVNRNSGEPLGLERRSVVAQQTVYHDAARPSHVVLPLIPPVR